MQPEVDNVGIAIVTESKDVAIDMAQFGLGELLELLGESVLKDIPFIKGVVACVTVPLAIRDRLFLRKVQGFLSAVPKFTDAEKAKFLAEHLADKKKADKLGETLVLVLDRLDDMEKPQMIAQVFAALVRGKITFDVFRRLASAIDLGAIDDLRAFANEKPPESPQLPRGLAPGTQTLRTNLARTGLVSLPSYHQTTPIMSVSFTPNDLGKVFKEIFESSLGA